MPSPLSFIQRKRTMRFGPDGKVTDAQIEVVAGGIQALDLGARRDAEPQAGL